MQYCSTTQHPVSSHVEAHIAHTHIALLHVLGVTILDLHYDLLWIELYSRHCVVSSTFPPECNSVRG